jgi:hypothetical protein
LKLSVDKKILFAIPLKCGDESTRYFINLFNDVYNPEEIWGDHLNITLDDSNLNNYDCIVGIVRNPYHRLVSGYLNKVLTTNYFFIDFFFKIRKILNID